MAKQKFKLDGLVIEVGRAKVYKWICPKCNKQIVSLHPKQLVAAAKSHLLSHAYRKKKE